LSGLRPHRVWESSRHLSDLWDEGQQIHASVTPCRCTGHHHQAKIAIASQGQIANEWCFTATPRFFEHHDAAKSTFEELDTALTALKNARPAAFAIGLIYGSVCALSMVPPSAYLPIILGRKTELPDPKTAARVLSLLCSLHNQLAEMVEDDLPLYVRRKEYSRDIAGLLLQARDRQQEATGFQEGLFSGVEKKGDMPKACATHVAQLVLEQRYLTSFERSIRAKKTLLDGEDLQRRHQELESRSASIAACDTIYCSHPVRSTGEPVQGTGSRPNRSQ
jgi:hypothetical protein